MQLKQNFQEIWVFMCLQGRDVVRKSRILLTQAVIYRKVNYLVLLL